MIVGITGHKGFIGKHLVKFLEKDSRYEVFPYWGNVSSAATNLIDSFVEESDVIVHLAGKNKGDDFDLLDTNILGTYNLAKACLKYDTKLIVAGAEYFKKNAYKASKSINNAILNEFYFNFNLNCASLIIPKVFGPGCKPFYNSFISTLFYLKAKNKEYKHLIKNENETFSLIYIDNLINMLVKLINMDNFIYPIQVVDNNHVYISIKNFISLLENPDENHKYNNIFQETLRWYKENEI